MSEFSKKEIKKRIEKLRKEINYHRYLYHVLDKPEISDAALDSLKHELDELEEKYPEFVTPDSPTQRIGGQPLDKFKKVEHKEPMLSLNDAFSEKEIIEWEKKIKKLLTSDDQLDYFVETKMDGLAVSLIYQNGIFVQGATRGNGKIGEDITQNLKTIEAIPLKLEIEKLNQKYQLKVQKEIKIRGEVFMSKKALTELNKNQEKNNQSLFANPRNAAAGSLRQLDSKITAQRKLDFYAYNLITDLGQATHQEGHQLINLLGLKDGQHRQYCKNLKEVFVFYKKISKIRPSLLYEIDGIVVNANKINIFEKLGVVGKAPRGAVAYKFPGLEATTKIKKIIIQVGRTGKLTPVALLEPVNLSGVNISRATLHNQDEIRRLDVRIGDTVIIQRAGDVIPDVVKVLSNLRTGREKKFQMPKKCQICESRIIKKEGEVDHYCLNKKCFATQLRGLYHFVSKKAFDIEHLGPKIIDHLVDKGLIKDAADIFYLKESDLKLLERFAEKSAQNLIEAIDRVKKISLARFVYALGIRHVGEETAQLLAQKFQISGLKFKIKDFVKQLGRWSAEELRTIEDIGPVVGQSIANWFRDQKNINLLEKLDQAGIELEFPLLHATSYMLRGKTFVLTGVLKSMTRDQAKDKVRLLGGKTSSSVSKETDYLVVGEEPGLKTERARKLGVRIIDEQEFLKMIK